MKSPSFWFLLLISISVPAIFCRHDYQYYIEKYHKGVSTTESSSSPGASTTAEVTALTSDVSPLLDITSLSEDSSSEENAIHVEGNEGADHNANGTILQGYSYNVDIQTAFIVRIVIIVGSIVLFVVVLGCVVCCCPGCCRGRERRGFVLGASRVEEGAIEAHPQQPLVSQPHGQPALVQHFPPNYNQEATQQFPAPYAGHLPPQYPQQQYSPQYPPGQPQSQYSPNTQQFYNPPEAPPPYDNAPPPHKY